MARFLLDSNILLRMLGPQSPHRDEAIRAILSLRSREDLPCITSQVLIEFWCVATRPVEQNGFGWSASEVAAQVEIMLRQFPLLEDNPTVFANWLQLVQSMGVHGKRVHDMRLVAIMQAHDVSDLLAFNTADFASCEGINVLSPTDIA